MTAQTSAQCDYCHATVPAGETFHPFATVTRCKDVAACERRQIRAYDPTIVPDEDRPAPPPAATPPGAVCAVCGASGTENGLYERLRGQCACLDRAACEQRAVEAQFLRSHPDSSPDQLVSSAQMRAGQAAAGAQIPPEPPPAGVPLPGWWRRP